MPKSPFTYSCEQISFYTVIASCVGHTFEPILLDKTSWELAIESDNVPFCGVNRTRRNTRIPECNDGFAVAFDGRMGPVMIFSPSELVNLVVPVEIENFYLCALPVRMMSGFQRVTCLLPGSYHCCRQRQVVCLFWPSYSCRERPGWWLLIATHRRRTEPPEGCHQNPEDKGL
jgi:hypothetical protein